MIRIRALAMAGLALASCTSGQAQNRFDDVEVKAESLDQGVAVLFGAGGNIGVSYGEDGTLIIDDQFAELTTRIEAAIADLGASPVEYVVNTHWHGDHSGGNANFGAKGAKIFAHENVRERLRVGAPESSRRIPPAPKPALPVVTYAHGVTLHLNGDTIDVRFTGGGHTDGDSIVLWREKNILHMGDLYFNITSFPYVDIESGGDANRLVASLDLALGMSDAETKIIPGHGPMSDRAALAEYREMVVESIRRVRQLRDSGLNLDQVRAERPLDDFDRGGGFIDADTFIGAIWIGLERE